jgi:hypothetical protein
MVLDELDRRNYSQATARTYVSAIRRFAKHFTTPRSARPRARREYQFALDTGPQAASVISVLADGGVAFCIRKGPDAAVLPP